MCLSLPYHRRRSGWTSGGTHGERRRWVGAERGGVWGGVSPLQPTKGSGGASWAPTAGSGAEPRPKTDFGVFWRPQNAHFLYLYDKIWGETICISVPRSKFWGDLFPLSFPRDLRPCPVPTRDPVVPMIFCPQYLGLLRAYAYTDWGFSRARGNW